jgi:phosphopantothenoylcysteine decarboxylase/phosphopantothenate--cysteine ligase
MSEPETVFHEVGRVLEGPSPLASKAVAVTAGPTLAPLDPVRYISNRSSGRMGYALAASSWRRGAETVLVTGPGRVPTPHGPRTVRVEEAGEMLDALADELERADVLLMAAAVADLRPAEVPEGKIRKADAPLDLTLETGPDLLEETRETRRERGIATLGFALETGGGEDRARAKMEAKGMDWVAVNEAGRAGVGPGAADNEVLLLGRDGGRLEIPVLPKAQVADRILDHLEGSLDG